MCLSRAQWTVVVIVVLMVVMAVVQVNHPILPYDGPPRWNQRIITNPEFKRPCSRLLLEPGSLKFGTTWTPEGNCVLHKYSRVDLQSCVKQRHSISNPDIWFLGDSRLRQHYSSFLGLFLKKTPNLKNATADGKWFVSKLGSLSAHYMYAKRIFIPEFRQDFVKYLTLPAHKRPGFIFLNSGLHYPRPESHNLTLFASRFESDLRNLSSLTAQVARSNVTKVIWKMEEPLNEKRLASYQTHTNAMMNAFNKLALKIMSEAGVYIWHSVVPMFMARKDYRDGIHLGDTTRKEHSILLANIYCQDIGSPWRKKEDL